MSTEDENFLKDDKDAAAKTRSLPLMHEFKVSEYDRTFYHSHNLADSLISNNNQTEKSHL